MNIHNMYILNMYSIGMNQTLQELKELETKFVTECEQKRKQVAKAQNLVDELTPELNEYDEAIEEVRRQIKEASN